MPDIKFSCPHCDQHLEAPDDMGGEQIECPSCRMMIGIPRGESNRPLSLREGDASLHLTVSPRPKHDKRPRGSQAGSACPRVRHDEQPCEPQAGSGCLLLFLSACFLGLAGWIGWMWFELRGDSDEKIMAVIVLLFAGIGLGLLSWSFGKLSGQTAGAKGCGPTIVVVALVIAFLVFVLPSKSCSFGCATAKHRLSETAESFMETWQARGAGAACGLLDRRSPVETSTLAGITIGDLGEPVDAGKNEWILKSTGELVSTHDYRINTVNIVDGYPVPISVTVCVARDTGKVYVLRFGM